MAIEIFKLVWYNGGMVCIAAFIILLLFGVVAAFLSIFKREIGRKYLRVIKKAWECVGKKVRLQKCQTNFKEDVKHSALKRIVLTKPGLVKPLSAIMEVLAILIVLVFVWAVLTSIKTLLALWLFGTCNISQPSSCALASETCSLESNEPNNAVEAVGRWFTEWGDIFVAIPDRLRDWHAEDYHTTPYFTVEKEDSAKPYATDIVDPGCSACMMSYRNQKESGFFDKYNTIMVIYPIHLPSGELKFKNSELIARYVYATMLSEPEIAVKILDRLYTEYDSTGTNYQAVLNELSEANAAKLIEKWLKDFGVSKTKIEGISGLTKSEQVNGLLEQARKIVEEDVRAKGIPTLIYDNKIHMGAYEAE